MPVLADPAHVYDGRPSGRMANVELTLPGSMLVNARGRRFVNEATNYHDLNKAFRTIDSATGTHAHIPAWLVVDSRLRRRATRSAARRPGSARRGRERGDTVDELARPADIDPDGLAATLEEFNRHAAEGRDPHVPPRGERAGPLPRRRRAAAPLPRPAGAAARTTRSRSGPARSAPAAGSSPTTTAGCSTGGPARSAGLFAAGNVSATVFADAYPGGGATLGSADHAGLRRRARARPSPLRHRA